MAGGLFLPTFDLLYFLENVSFGVLAEILNILTVVDNGGIDGGLVL